ncbi:MAG: hypothetical protein ACR2QG_11670 [Gammaproteobacteria bacterium]
MDIPNFSQIALSQAAILAAAALGAFVVGFVLARLFPKKAVKSGEEDPRNHRIRELEADLRSTNRKLEVSVKLASESSDGLDNAQKALKEYRDMVIDRDEEIDKLNADLKVSVKRTRDLRNELQDRASETIREQFRAKEAETELEVARAGSEAVLSEISRLQEERETLTNTMRKLEANMLPEEELFGEGGWDKD